MSRSIAALTSSAIVFATLAIASPAAAAPLPGAEPAGCSTATIIALRGSGENKAKNTGDEKLNTLASNGWEGDLSHKALLAYEDAAELEGVDISSTKIVGIGPDNGGYPAVGVMDVLAKGATDQITFKGNLFTSAYSKVLLETMIGAKSGTRAAILALQSERNATLDAGCAMPMFLTIGYSQGQMAARMLKALQADIGAMLSFGDPFQVGLPDPSRRKAAGLTGTGADGQGLYTRSSQRHEALGEADPVAMKNLNRVYSESIPRYLICHDTDPFCDFSNFVSLANSETHSDYVTERWEKMRVGNWLLETLNTDTSSAVPAEADPLSVETDIHPWWGGWEARVNISGLPAASTVEFEIVEWKKGVDPWDPSLETVGTLTAVPGRAGVTGLGSLIDDAPAEVPSGTHSVIVPTEIHWGAYNIRYLSKTGAQMSDDIYIDDPAWPHDWFWQDLFPDGRYPVS